MYVKQRVAVPRRGIIRGPQNRDCCSPGVRATRRNKRAINVGLNRVRLCWRGHRAPETRSIVVVFLYCMYSICR